MTATRTHRLPLFLGSLTLIASALAACGTADEPVPSPTPTPAFASDEDAFAAAEKAYRDYIDAFSMVDVGDASSFEDLFTRTRGDFEASDRESLSEFHAEGYTFVGMMTVLSFAGIDINANRDMMTAIVCLDVSEFDILDSSGTSVVAQDRPDRNSLSVEFVRSDGDVQIERADRTETDAACTML